jgi:hypothetical protein
MPVRDYDQALTGPRGLVVSAWGTPKTGKTHFSFGFPEPLYLLNFDLGGEFEPMARYLGKEIHVTSFHIEEDYDTLSWNALLTDFCDTYHARIEEAASRGGTVVIDTATQLWTLIQKVKLDDIKQVRLKKLRQKDPDAHAAEVVIHPFDYSDASSKMNGLLRYAAQYPATNLVLTHWAAPIYVGSDKTNRIEPQGFNAVPAIVHANIQLFTEGGENASVETPVTPMARITSCRADVRLEGMTLANPTYELIRAMLGR